MRQLKLESPSILYSFYYTRSVFIFPIESVLQFSSEKHIGGLYGKISLF